MQETISESACLQSLQLPCAQPGDDQPAGGLRDPRLVLHLDLAGLCWGDGDGDLQQDVQHPPLPGPRSGPWPPGLQPPAASPVLSQVAGENILFSGKNLIFKTFLLLRSDHRGRNERAFHFQHFATKIIYDFLCVLGLTSTVASLRGNDLCNYILPLKGFLTLQATGCS